MIREYHTIPFGTYHCPHCGTEFNFHGSQDRLICPECTFDITAYAMPKLVNDPINTLAAQFDELNRQDRKALRDERDAFRHVIASIVNQEGGTYLLGDRARFFTKSDAEVSFRTDTFNRCIAIKTTDATVSEKPIPPQNEPMPDWML